MSLLLLLKASNPSFLHCFTLAMALVNCLLNRGPQFQTNGEIKSSLTAIGFYLFHLPLNLDLLPQQFFSRFPKVSVSIFLKTLFSTQKNRLWFTSGTFHMESKVSRGCFVDCTLEPGTLAGAQKT